MLFVFLPKLDVVGPVYNRPSTKQLRHLFRKRRRRRKITKNHVTPDTWHVTRDMWHVTCDTWRRVNILSIFQLPSSNSLGFMISWRLRGKGSVTEWINELINDNAVCRTAPATMSLLITSLWAWGWNIAIQKSFYITCTFFCLLI